MMASNNSVQLVEQSKLKCLGSMNIYWAGKLSRIVLQLFTVLEIKDAEVVPTLSTRKDDFVNVSNAFFVG